MNRDPKYRYIVASLASPVGWWLGRRIGMPDLEIWFALLFPGIALLITDLRLNFRARERPKIPAHLQTYPEHLPEGEDRILRLAVVDCLEKIPNLRDARFHRFQGCHNGELARPGANFLSTPGRHVPRLEGNILLISLFVGVDGRPWSDSEIARQLRAVHRAGRWMEREASRWGHEVLVAMPDTYFQVLDAADQSVAIDFALDGEEYVPVEPAASIEALELAQE